jgi:LacI family transcriptional regulator
MNAAIRDLTDILHLIILDRTSGTPLHLQLRNALRRIILESMHDGDKMPPEELIAERLRLSRTTVRRALNDLASDRLLERRRSSGTLVIKVNSPRRLSNVAIIMPDFESYPLSTNSNLLGAIDKERRAIHADLKMLRFKKGEEWNSFERLIPYSPAEGGVILLGNPAQATEDLYRILSARGYRVVNIDAYYDGYSGSYAGICNRSALELGLNHLYQLGHRNISFLIGEPEEVYAVRERCKVFGELARKLGLHSAEIFHGGSHYWEHAAHAAANAMPEAWEKKHRPTAIFAISDHSAIGCLSWLQRNGVRVPEDVSLLSFDGTQLCRMVTPRLTSLVQPVDAIARETFRILAGSEIRPEQIFLPPILREGDSTERLRATS